MKAAKENIPSIISFAFQHQTHHVTFAIRIMFDNKKSVKMKQKFLV